MKVSAVVLLSTAAMLSSMVTAAPPRGGFQRFRSFSQRQVEAAPEEPEVPPYPPSGWKPEKPFYLPGEEVTTEADAEVLTTTAETPTTEAATTATPEDAEPEASPSIPVNARNKLTLASLSQPNYYVLLPHQQQRTAPQRSYQFLIPDYSTPTNNAYVLRDVESFGAPIYFLGEQGGLLVQLADRR